MLPNWKLFANDVISSFYKNESCDLALMISDDIVILLSKRKVNL